MDRRKFLRMFGIGATIVPIVGAGTTPVAGRLLEAPKVELVGDVLKNGIFPEGIYGSSPMAMSSNSTVTITVNYHHPITGREETVTAHGALLDVSASGRDEWVDVTSITDHYPKFIPTTRSPRIEDWRISLLRA